jgi:hypothetical protein
MLNNLSAILDKAEPMPRTAFSSAGFEAIKQSLGRSCCPH